MAIPPRILSVSDPEADNVFIYLDGVLQTGVLDYNQDTGVLTRYKRQNNKFVTVKGAYQTETVSGNITVKYIKEPQ